MRERRSISRGLLFALVVVASVAVGGGYVAWAVLRDGAATRSSPSPRPSSVKKRGAIVFQNVTRDANYVHVAMVPASDPRAPRRIAGLMCERVHFAAGRGLCLIPERSLINPRPVARIFGPDFRVRRQIRLSGIITRARVSPDGRYGAATTFVAGHSYADDNFSTQTMLIDMTRGVAVDNLEEFRITRAGGRFWRRDFNFWGVTFARDSNRFYATLGTRGRTYLIEGDVRARRAIVLREDVECPSLSPDGTRIVFKKNTGDRWRLHVLDLKTGHRTALAETHSVDDQVEWLDDRQLLYGFGGHVWVVPADGSGQPQRFLSDALSPAVIR